MADRLGGTARLQRLRAATSGCRTPRRRARAAGRLAVPLGHLVGRRGSLQHLNVVDEPEPPLTREDANALISMVMRLDANIQLILDLIREIYGGEEEEGPDADA